eukprot:Lankesteria_metandrocarpae@DN5259_c0_g4_i2.p2
MNSENQQSAVALLCANQCGFYGSPTTRNLCSKCYRDAIRRDQQAIVPQSSNAQSSDGSESFGTALSGASSAFSGSPLVVTGSSSSPPAMLYKESDRCESSSSNNSNDISNSCQSLDIAIDPEPSETSSALNPDEAAAGVLSVSAQLIAAEPNKPEQVTRSRCWHCNKRVGLLGFQCRCGYFFCGAHRHGDTHSCDFDYKTFEREQLSRANQKIVAEKVTKI